MNPWEKEGLTPEERALAVAKFIERWSAPELRRARQRAGKLVPELHVDGPLGAAQIASAIRAAVRGVEGEVEKLKESLTSERDYTEMLISGRDAANTRAGEAEKERDEAREYAAEIRIRENTLTSTLASTRDAHAATEIRLGEQRRVSQNWQARFEDALARAGKAEKERDAEAEDKRAIVRDFETCIRDRDRYHKEWSVAERKWNAATARAEKAEEEVERLRACVGAAASLHEALMDTYIKGTDEQRERVSVAAGAMEKALAAVALNHVRTDHEGRPVLCDAGEGGGEKAPMDALATECLRIACPVCGVDAGVECVGASGRWHYVRFRDGCDARPLTTMETITLRPEVQRFAEAMEAKLRKHDPERGPRGWLGDDTRALLGRVRQELEGLIVETFRPMDPAGVLSAAADVANFSMMVSDVCGALATGALATKEAPDA